MKKKYLNLDPYLGTFRLEFQKFGTKNVLFEYFWAKIHIKVYT